MPPKKKVSDNQVREAMSWIEEEEETLTSAARRLGIYHSALRKRIDKLKVSEGVEGVGIEGVRLPEPIDDGPGFVAPATPDTIEPKVSVSKVSEGGPALFQPSHELQDVSYPLLEVPDYDAAKAIVKEIVEEDEEVKRYYSPGYGGTFDKHGSGHGPAAVRFLQALARFLREREH